MGGLFACIPLKRPRVAVENLLASFGPALSRPEAERLYRRLMGHFGAMLFELPHIFTMTERSLSRYVTFDHPERMEQALAKGKGCFILTAHFGNWELMSAAACLRYAPNAAVVARPMDFPPVERLFIDLRTRFGTGCAGSYASCGRTVRSASCSIRTSIGTPGSSCRSWGGRPARTRAWR